MIQKQIGNWLIEFDREATEIAYTNVTHGITCDCQPCQNYDKACSAFPVSVRNFFDELGIDISKPAELMNFTIENNVANMGGWYHIVGNYLDGDDVWQPVAPKHSHQKTTVMFTITDGFQIGFTHMVALVEEGFPHPVIQMEINFYVPWVLDEPYNEKPPTKKEISEMNLKIHKKRLLEEIKEFIDISRIDSEAECWDIDKINHMGVEVFDSGTIVYFSDEHKHFWEHDNNDDYDFIIETAAFVKDLLTGQTRFERSYRGTKLVRVAYYTKAANSDEWILQQNFGTALFRPLLHFPKKVVKTEIIEFKQQ